MKIRIVLFSILAFLLVAVIYNLISAFTYKHAYTTKPVGSFALPELKSDQLNINFAASDTSLYVVSWKDNTKTEIDSASNTATFTTNPKNDITTCRAFDFQGKQELSFHLPADSVYQGLMIFGGDFGFLTGLNQLYIDNWDKNTLDFYSPLGIPIDQKQIPASTHVAEFDGHLYYVIGTKEGKDILFKLLKDNPGKRTELIRRVSLGKNLSIFTLFVHSNGKNDMAVAEVQEKKILISFFADKKEKKFEITRHANNHSSPWYFYLWDWQTISKLGKEVLSRIPLQHDYLPDDPFGMYVGKNYVVLTTWGYDDDSKPTMNTIYNLHGRNLGELKCKEDNHASLVDICGDKL
ncbi:MAG TPA: hypothetical protein PLE74_07135, partial [Candidatus Cloacimonadota bacterium]|nr:hypothetical protein [Candidatus Cloacimonadota bacterium]